MDFGIFYMHKKLNKTLKERKKRVRFNTATFKHVFWRPWGRLWPMLTFYTSTEKLIAAFWLRFEAFAWILWRDLWQICTAPGVTQNKVFQASSAIAILLSQGRDYVHECNTGSTAQKPQLTEGHSFRARCLFPPLCALKDTTRLHVLTSRVYDPSPA